MFINKINAWEFPRLSGETTDAEFVERRNRRYYEEQLEDNIKWCSRIGVPIRVDPLRINQKERNRLTYAFNLLWRIPFLERFFTVSIYAVLGRARKSFNEAGSDVRYEHN